MSRTLQELSRAAGGAERCYVRVNQSMIYGPVSMDKLIEWAEQGRIMGGAELSFDRLDWVAAESLEELHLDWIADNPDGHTTTPFHLLALALMVRRGTVHENAHLRNRVTGKTLSVPEALERNTETDRVRAAGGRLAQPADDAAGASLITAAQAITQPRPEPAAPTEETLAPLRAEMDAQAARLNALQERSDARERELTIHIHTLQRQIALGGEEVERLRDAMTATQQRADRHEAHLADRIADLEATVKHERDGRATAEARADRLAEQLEDVREKARHDADAAREALARLRDESALRQAELEAERTRLDNDAKAETAKLTEALEATRAQLQATRTAAEAEQAKTTITLDTLKKDLAKAEQGIADARKRESAAAQEREKALTDLRGRLDKLSAEKAELTRTSQAQQATLEKTREEQTQAEKQGQETQRKLQAAEEALAKAKAQQAEGAQAAADLKKKLEAVEADRDAAKAELEAERKVQAEVTTAATDKTGDLKKRMTALTEALSQAEAARDKAREESAATAERLEALSGEKEALQSARDAALEQKQRSDAAAREQGDKLKSATDEAQAHREASVKAAAEAATQRAELEAALAAASNGQSELQTRLENATAQLQALQEVHAADGAQREALEARLEKADERIVSLEAALEKERALTQAQSAIVAAEKPEKPEPPAELAESEPADAWRLKLDDGQVLGPVPVATLADWARQCRLGPDHEVSTDGHTWQLAASVPALGMDWMVPLVGGGDYGPLCREAIPELVADGVVDGDGIGRNQSTGELMAVSELISMASAPRS